MTRTTRTPVTSQEALVELSRAHAGAQAAGQALSQFLETSSIPNAVAVSLSLRARALLMEAADHLDAAAQRLEQTQR
jgi:hypothetical protein